MLDFSNAQAISIKREENFNGDMVYGVNLRKNNNELKIGLNDNEIVELFEKRCEIVGEDSYGSLKEKVRLTNKLVPADDFEVDIIETNIGTIYEMALYQSVAEIKFKVKEEMWWDLEDYICNLTKTKTREDLTLEIENLKDEVIELNDTIEQLRECITNLRMK